MALILWPIKEIRPEYTPRFHYKFTGKALREGDIVDGVHESTRQFIYDAEVIRPNCLEFGYDRLRNMDYRVEVRVGDVCLFLNRNDISNVRRPYRIGDWA
jgi:hypothetical protein